MGSNRLTLVWALTSLGMGGYLALAISGDGEGRRIFLPGRTTDGHHQIELACSSCHSAFGGVRQEACLECHEAEFEAALDSHAPSLFNDPRNAADLDRLDVRECITCHTEHRPELTGVTLPSDFCYPCHDTIAEDRPTHRELSSDTCASAGCHNYHDNRTLYADFLMEHGTDEPGTSTGKLPPRETWVPWEHAGRAPLTAADADGLDAATTDRDLVDAWASSAHSAAGVACSHCHQPDGAAWIDDPSATACDGCHELETEGFLGGKHGMRLSVDMDPMSPSLARLPMKPDAAAKTLSCSSCHDAHTVDVRHAAVDGCLGVSRRRALGRVRRLPAFLPVGARTVRRRRDRKRRELRVVPSAAGTTPCRGQRGRRRAAQPERESATQRKDASRGMLELSFVRAVDRCARRCGVDSTQLQRTTGASRSEHRHGIVPPEVREG